MILVSNLFFLVLKYLVYNSTNVDIGMERVPMPAFKMGEIRPCFMFISFIFVGVKTFLQFETPATNYIMQSSILLAMVNSVTHLLDSGISCFILSIIWQT